MQLLLTVMLSVMLVACMAVGWIARSPERRAATASASAGASPAPAPKSSESPEPPAPKEKEALAETKIEEKEKERPAPERKEKAKEKAKAKPKQPPVETKALLTYEKDVLPIMRASCVRCHESSAKKKKGGLDLTTYSALVKGGASGPGVRAGKPEMSPLWE